MTAVSKFVIKKTYCDYQAGPGGKLRIRMLMDDLQGIAQINADVLGFGSEFCHKNKVGWALTNYVVDIIEMPTFNEEISIITWPSGSSAIRANRDFELRGSDGRLLVRATSQWVIIDIETRRLVKIPQVVLDYNDFPPRALESEFEKIEDMDNCQLSTVNCQLFPVLFDDFDSNGHVNNTSYTVWATESLGYEFLGTHTLTGLKINFKKELTPETESVSAYYKMSGTESHHMIQTNGQTNCTILCTWAQE